MAALLAALLLSAGIAAAAGTAESLTAEASRLIIEEPAGVILFIGEPDGALAEVAAGHEADGDAVRADQPFRVGSVTKSFVAAVVMQLSEEGVVDLDASASRYLSHPTLPPAVTVRHLLGQTSGIADYVNAPGYWDRVRCAPSEPLTPAEILRFVPEGLPSIEAGSEHRYSNTNDILLGLIFESVTGDPVADVIRQRVTKPLRLGHTYLAGDETGPAVIHEPIWIPDEWDGRRAWACPTGLQRDYPYASHATPLWTAGAMVSNASDLDVFFRSLFDGALLDQASIAQVIATEPIIGANDPMFVGYGLGLTAFDPPSEGRDEPGPTWYGHGGGVAGFTTIAMHEPTSRSTVVYAATDARIDYRPVVRQMADWVETQPRGAGAGKDDAPRVRLAAAPSPR